MYEEFNSSITFDLVTLKANVKVTPVLKTYIS